LATGVEDMQELRDELALVRAELAKARRAQEEAEEKLGKQRRARLKAERQAELLAKSLSDVLVRQFRTQVRRSRLRNLMDSEVPTQTEWTQILLLRQSPYFWPGWYLRQNPDVAEAGKEPALHFLRNGWKEGRDPSPNFSVRRHLDKHPDVRRTRQNPLMHAIETGTTPTVKHKRRRQDS
jgi:hypothetical protein